nr:DUF192 domain-containing protein [Stutzerimonas azotifigens]
MDLNVGEAPLRAEFADDADTRQRGLMEREALPADQGMLFRFPEIRRHCLWMKNTPLPLSAAFIDEAGRIVDLIDLEPLSVAIRCSREPARYALEVNQGWFAEHRAGLGSRVEGLPGPPPGD